MKIHRDPELRRAVFWRARDGDTVVVLLHIGLDVWRETAIRLVGIESWELGSENDERANNAAMIQNAAHTLKLCYVRASRRGLDRYGRLRGDVIIDGRSLAEINVNVGIAWRADRDKEPHP